LRFNAETSRRAKLARSRRNAMVSLFRISPRRGVSLFALAVALGAASACNQSTQTAANAAPPPGALPPVSMAAPLVDAPAAQALPAALPPPIGHVASRRQGYAFADRAYAMSDAFSDAPPDYTYDYDGARPWVWRSSDDSERVVEAVPGGERVYYYEPGSDQPFFVQDPQYGYGFENGALVTVYDRSGRELADAEAAARAEWAGRYLARARALYEASRREQREAVAEQNWEARRDYLDAQRQAWRQQQDQDADWRAYHEQYYPAEQAHYAAERQQRLAWAARVDQMNNDPARAQREWQAAQQAAQQRTSGPPVGSPPGGPRFAQQPPQPPLQAPMAAPPGPLRRGQQAFGRPPNGAPPSAALPGPQGAQQAAAARAAQVHATQEHAALLAAQQKQQAQTQAAAAARQRQAAAAQAEAAQTAEAHAQLLAKQQAAAAAQQHQAALAAQQHSAVQAQAQTRVAQEAQAHSKLIAEQQAAQQRQAALAAQQHAAAQAQAAQQAHAKLAAEQQAAAQQHQAALAAQQHAAAQAQAAQQAQAHARLAAEQQAAAKAKAAAEATAHPAKPGEAPVATKQQ
jgi:hypothetical protein